MRIAVISDSHDNIWKLSEAMPLLMQVDVVLHCGDLISPFMIKRLVEGLGSIPVHLVWGNNDGDKNLLRKLAQESGSITVHGHFADLDINGNRIAINHYPEIARREAEVGKYDLVCYGHDHTAHHEKIGETHLLNPGELMGMNGRSTFAIFDTQSKVVDWIELKG
jgi:putative phosphoesterase